MKKMTNNPALNELSLEDKFLEEIKTEAAVTPASETKAEAASLPSVLIDEQLLAELASIPDRFGFKIGDVADLLGIKQYVLRYWEEEFEILKPKKASNNQRLYTKKDVENAFLIRKLLYRDKFSIEGARQALKDVKFALKKEKDFNSVIQRIDFVQTQIKSFVDEIKKTKELFN
jgi:DNA-binding transcriptional MerR regulator